MEPRKLEVDDGPWLRAKAQIYAATMYPEFIPDIEKLHWLVRDCTYSPEKHYCRVVGPEGEPQAALLTRTSNNLWAMKQHASVLFWYSEIPGAGAMLLRGFRDWVKEQSQIVVAGFNADFIGATGPLRVAERIGFKRRGEGSYVFYPRGEKK